MVYANVKNNMPSLDLGYLLQVPRWRGISTKGHILIVIMIIQSEMRYNACTYILAHCSWCFWRVFSYLHVFHTAVFYLEIKVRRGLEDLTSHLLSYGYLAWVNSLSSILTRLN